MIRRFFGKVRFAFSFLFLRSKAKNLVRINNQFEHFKKLGGMLAGRTPPICTDIAAWATRTPAGKMLGSIGHEEQVRRTLPSATPAAPFVEQQTFQVHPRPVVRIEGATLLGSEGFLVLPDGQHVLQTVWYPRQLTRDAMYYQRAPRPAIEKRGTYFSLSFYWSRSYYHWLTETLPLLHGIAPFLPAGTRHIISGPAQRFQLDCLRLLGVPPEQFVEIDPSESWRVETLIFSPPATTDYTDLPPRAIRAGRYTLRTLRGHRGPFNHSPDGLRWLAERLIDGSRGQPPPPLGTRLYISRRKAACRRLNEDDIAPVLAAHGVAACTLEDLSLAEQIQLLNQAELVVAPHGAGLSNLMFCRPGTRVIEIFEPSVQRLCYWSISDIMRLRYSYLMGERVVSNSWDPDIWIDPRVLDQALRDSG